MQRRKNRKLNFQYTARNDRILSERVRRSEADAGASLKFIILGVTRYTNLKIIIQSAARMASKNNKQAYPRNQKNPIKQKI